MIVEIRDYLVAQSLGTAGVNLFMETMPKEPNAAVSLVEYPGGAPEYTMGGSGPVWENCQFQVLVRDSDPSAARTKARSIWTALAAINSENVTGHHYIEIEPLQSPFPLMPDDQERTRIVFNCRAVRSL